MNGTIYCRKGMWYVNAVIDGRRNRRSLGTRSETRARLLSASPIPRCSETETLLPEEPVIARRLPFLPGVRARNRWNGVMTRAALQRTGWLPKLYRRMMARCAIKGWVSDVTMEDLIAFCGLGRALRYQRHRVHLGQGTVVAICTLFTISRSHRMHTRVHKGQHPDCVHLRKRSTSGLGRCRVAEDVTGDRSCPSGETRCDAGMRRCGWW